MCLFVVTDINECQVHPQLCEQECTDTYTAYECGCRAGYKLENNSHNCTGVLGTDTALNYAYFCKYRSMEIHVYNFIACTLTILGM